MPIPVHARWIRETLPAGSYGYGPDSGFAGADRADRVGAGGIAQPRALRSGGTGPVSCSRRLTGLEVSTRFLAGGPWPRRATAQVTAPSPGAGVTDRRAGVTCRRDHGRAATTLSYEHVACTEYLTVMHVGDRSAKTIDAGQVLPEFTRCPGPRRLCWLPASPGFAWCRTHLLRDLRSISDADPDRQLWASAMADVLRDAHHAATTRDNNTAALDPGTLAPIRNHYLGTLALGTDENRCSKSKLHHDARTLLDRFRRYEDMILRFAIDMAVPFTKNEAERSSRPVKVQQRTSGGAWPTLQGLTDFAVVTSYLDTAHKWGITKLDALTELFTTGSWLPHGFTPAE